MFLSLPALKVTVHPRMSRPITSAPDWCSSAMSEAELGSS
jgi:hypothetical protein